MSCFISGAALIEQSRPIAVLIAELAVGHEKYTGNKPGRSVNLATGQLTGPFVRFISAIFHRRGIPVVGIRHASRFQFDRHNQDPGWSRIGLALGLQGQFRWLGRCVPRDAALAAGAGDMKLNSALDAQVIPFGDSRPPAFSDEALALLLPERHAGNLRYVAPWRKWLAWDGTRWRFDNTLHAFDRARPGGVKDPRVQTAVASAKTVAAVERLAKSDRRLAAQMTSGT
jgi:D5 N terminal like